MRVRTVLLVLAMLLPCIAVAANQVYRWKDAHGVVHFADAPPPEGTKYKIVNIKTGVTRDPPAPARPATTAPKPATNTAAAAPKTVKDTPDNRAKLCQQLAENINVLQSSQVATLGNSDTPMTAEQRAQQLAQAQEQQQQFCSN